MAKWKEIVRTVAPGLATLLTGGNPLAGMAVKAIGNALLGDENAGEDAVEAAILQASPEALAKVRIADKELTAKLKELDIDLARIAKEDRAGARALAVSRGLTPQVILASIFVLGFIAVLYSVFTGAAPLTDSTRDVVIYLLGILSAGITQVMNFFFGSSAGSKQKTEVFRDMR